MGVRAEIEGFIKDSWTDKDVANWVIKKLPLLEFGFTHPSCPVYGLSLEQGLIPLNDTNFSLSRFKEKDKLVMSGGFEGTEGHIKVIKEMFETRILANRFRSPIVLMLEPDSYVQKQKKREPLVNLNQRIALWSTSGLVEAVMVLPQKPDNMSSSDFYDYKIHELIQPATWCVNIENPHFFEIMNRGIQSPNYDLVRLFVNHIEVHTSFLNSTSTLSKAEVKERLNTYVLELIKGYRNTESPDEEAKIFTQRIAEGL